MIDPFANMVPLNQMENDIAYHMARDAGYDPEIHLHDLVEQKELALKTETNEVIAQLWENVNQAITLFSELLKEVRSSQPYRAARIQSAHLSESIKALETHKIETQRILTTLQSHLQQVQAQQRAYQEKLASLRKAQKKQAAHNAFASFVCDCGERYRQTMVYQSAGITSPASLPSFPSGSGVDSEELLNFPKTGLI